MFYKYGTYGRCANAYYLPNIVFSDPDMDQYINSQNKVKFRLRTYHDDYDAAFCVGDFMTWIPGDANADFSVNVGDGVFLVNYVFKGGQAPEPARIGDINGDCDVNVGDAVYVIDYIFKGGDAPLVGCAE